MESQHPSLRFCGSDYTELFIDLKQTAWLGDRDDHVKIVFKGKNGCIVDMEISGGVAAHVPEYLIYGSRGSLVGENNTLKLKYLDPEVELQDVKADPATPGSGAAFGNSEELVWKEETIELQKEDQTAVIWDHFYEAYRNHKPYPIASEQALEVVRVLEEVKFGTEFL